MQKISIFMNEIDDRDGGGKSKAVPNLTDRARVSAEARKHRVAEEMRTNLLRRKRQRQGRADQGAGVAIPPDD